MEVNCTHKEEQLDTGYLVGTLQVWGEYVAPDALVSNPCSPPKPQLQWSLHCFV